MPGWWQVAIAFFVIAGIGVLAAVGGAVTKNVDTKFGGIVVAVVAGLVLGGGSTLIASYDRVDTRNVGVITTFGKPVGVHGAGVVWHAPWQQVHELSEAIQLQAFESTSYDEAASGKKASDASLPAINVRLANNSNAFVDMNLNWRLREGAAPKLFQDYGGNNVFNTIREQLVDRQAQVMVSKVFASFNPQLLTPSTKPGQPSVATPATAQGVDLPKMAEEVKKDLQDAVGTEVEILDVRVPRLYYDQPTQQRIDAYNQKVQETLNAQQDVRTAEQNRLAAEERAKQPPPDLHISIATCMYDMVHQGKDPAGCWGQIGGQPLIQLPHQ